MCDEEKMFENTLIYAHSWTSEMHFHRSALGEKLKQTKHSGQI